MAYRGYKYRLYPDSEARAFFARCFGATRYIYNYCVRQYDAATAEGREVSGFDIMALAREHMKDLAWLSDVDYEVKESAPKRFDKALSKYKRYQANRPREHKKGEQSYVSYTTGGVIKVDFKHDLVQLPKIGIVKARLHRPFSGEITTATIKREADSNYYISFTVKCEDTTATLKPHTAEGTVGIDVGLRHLATLSDGTTIDMPDAQRCVARLQFLKSRLERQKPGSKRYYRTKLQIARLHHHLANVSKDTHQKVAASLCSRYDTICMETLNIDGMRKGQGESKTSGEIVFNAELHRTALALFVDRVKQKAADTSTNFVSIDRWEPSTKTCSHCGYVLPTIDVHTKEWTCPDCGTHHDRDINAAINIRNRGLELMEAKPKSEPNESLPMAEGNVKPAKKATAGCDLRTGKGKAQSGRPPKAQIADGTAPPRIFNKPGLAIKSEAWRYLRILAIAREADIEEKRINSWIKRGVAKEETTQYIRLIDFLSCLSSDCRQADMTTTDRLTVSDEMLRRNRFINMGILTEELLHHRKPFTWWRNIQHTKEELDKVNDFYSANLPDMIDDFIEECKSLYFGLEKTR